MLFRSINITPNGTGDVYLDSDTVYVGDSGSAATITTNGSAALTVSSQGSNNIIIDPGSGTTLNDGHMILGVLNTNAILTTNGTGDLTIHTNGGTNSGYIQIPDGANANITIEPNGTGNIYLNSSTVQIGDNNVNATLTTNGTGDLVLNTNNGSSSGSITIAEIGRAHV